jgi:hypothetical protein
MKNNNKGGIQVALVQREEFLHLVVVVAVLALGINLVASYLGYTYQNYKSYILILGIFLIIVSFVYLISLMFNKLNFKTCMEAVLIFNPENLSIVPVHSYGLVEHLRHILHAVFLENKALENMWQSEPIVNTKLLTNKNSNKNSGRKNDSQNGSGGNQNPRTFVGIWCQDIDENDWKANLPKSAVLLQEALEFVILEELSSHLSDYFKDYGDDNELYEYTRDKIPELLIKNRILGLLSTPLEDREIFLEINKIQKSVKEKGKLIGIKGPNGEIFSRFDLILPIGTKVTRPQLGHLKLENNRFILDISIDYAGFSVNLPDGFEEYYLGVPRKTLAPKSLKIDISSSVKKRSFLHGSGWKYYKWIDSFLTKLEHESSFPHFLERIGWNTVSTQILTMHQTAGSTKEQDKTNI